MFLVCFLLNRETVIDILFSRFKIAGSIDLRIDYLLLNSNGLVHKVDSGTPTNFANATASDKLNSLAPDNLASRLLRVIPIACAISSLVLPVFAL
nr:MAG TPA: hypothetical protein [Caudoviricetes sp.]